MLKLLLLLALLAWAAHYAYKHWLAA